MTDLVQETI